MSKEMPCGHTWAEFVSCDTEGGTLMCGICEPIGERVAQLLTENAEHLKQIGVLEIELVKFTDALAGAQVLSIDLMNDNTRLKTERDAFKLLYTLSAKPVDATQEEIIKAHQIVNAFFKAEKEVEKDLSALEALEQIGEIPGVQEALKTGEEKHLGDPFDMKEQIKKVMKHGPTRVMFNTSGDATTPMRAKRDHNVVPDVIFIRKDGWSLGAPDSLVEVARTMYPKEWIGSFRPQDHVESGE